MIDSTSSRKSPDSGESEQTEGRATGQVWIKPTLERLSLKQALANTTNSVDSASLGTAS